MFSSSPRSLAALLAAWLFCSSGTARAACPIPYHQELLLSDYDFDYTGNVARPSWLPAGTSICFWGTENEAVPRVAMLLSIPEPVPEYIALGYTTIRPRTAHSTLYTPAVYAFPDDWDQTTNNVVAGHHCASFDWGMYQMGSSSASFLQNGYVTNDLVPGSFYYKSDASHVELAFEKDAADAYAASTALPDLYRDFAWQPSLPDQYFTVIRGGAGKKEYCGQSARNAGKLSGERRFTFRVPSSLTINKPPVFPTTTVSETCDVTIPPATDFLVPNGSVVLDIRRSTIFPEQNALTVYFHVLARNKLFSASFDDSSLSSEPVRAVSPGLREEDQSSSLLIEGFPRACYSMYERTTTWNAIIAGGRYQRVVDSHYTSYFFILRVRTENFYASDELGGQPVNREVVDSFPFQIRYQRAVDATLSALQVFAPPDLNGNVLLETQSISVDLDDNQSIHGRVRIRSQMAYPYRLCTATDGALCDTAPGIVFPDGLGGAFAAPPLITLLQDCEDPGTVAAGETANCEQLWDIEFFPSPFGVDYLVCTLSGDNYKLTGSAQCHPSASTTPCPIQASDDTSVTFDFTLNSDNFCPTLQTSVSIDANLQAYATEARVASTTQYSDGETAVFELTITDTLGTVIADSVEIDSVELECVSSSGTSTRLYHRDLGGSSGTVANFIVHNSAGSDPAGNAASDNPNEAWFSFTASAAACPASTTPLVGMSLSVIGNAHFASAIPLLAIPGEPTSSVVFQGVRHFTVVSVGTQAPTETQPEGETSAAALCCGGLRWAASAAAVIAVVAHLL